MKRISIQTVKEAKLNQINKKSVILENTQTGDYMWCTRQVFNQIQRIEDENFPCYIIERDYMGTTRPWVAIPMTI